jgi:hypothetical protein
MDDDAIMKLLDTYGNRNHATHHVAFTRLLPCSKEVSL